MICQICQALAIVHRQSLSEYAAAVKELMGNAERSDGEYRDALRKTEASRIRLESVDAELLNHRRSCVPAGSEPETADLIA